MGNKSGGISPAPAAGWLVGGGRMGETVRSMDWSRNPLGPIDRWPESLRTTVNLALASNFPISLAWGPNRIQIYNDGYWPICGGKHPEAMGQDFKECWFSAWPVIGDAFESAAAGTTAFLENQRMFLDRNGYLEETFFTFSFSPIRDETGAVAGLFHPVTEMTAQSLAERRLGVLRELADEAGNARSLDESVHLVMQVLERHQLDVPFAALYLVEGGGSHARLAGAAHLPADRAPTLTTIALEPGRAEAGAWPLAEAVQAETVWECADLAGRFGAIDSGPYPEPPDIAQVLPIYVAGVNHPLAILVAAVSPRRALDDTYRTFFVMLQEAVANALASARSYEEEKKRSEALAQLDKAKTAFFSNVSHEFRTPLTLMLGPLEEVLAEQQALPSLAQEHLQVAYRNALRLLKLVNSLLDFSRIESGRARASYRATDLAPMTADLASSFRSACEKAGLFLDVHCAELAEPVYVDHDMWEKIVLNLLSNAFKFTLEGGIRVTLQAEDGHAVLRVADTGVGVAAHELPRLFERFHRVEGARGRTFEGTGIGLALVQELVKLHGGAIEVQSELENGTTFTVRVPLGTAHLPSERIDGDTSLSSTATRAEAYVEEALRWLQPDDASNPVEPAPVPAAANPVGEDRAHGARVLLADDNADMRAYVERLLKSRYVVETAEHGRVALEKARQLTPDLVLTDIMMPHLDGLGLLQALRSDPKTRSVPVILLSARAGDEARVEGIEAGADDYLVKPFSSRELLARVETHLRLAAMRRETEAQLREVDRRKDEFLAVLGHELRNPLAAITNALEILRLNPDSAAGERAKGIMGRQLTLLTRMVDDLLEVPRVTHGKLQLDRRIIEIGSVVRAAMDEMRPQADAQEHELTSTLAAQPICVDGDPVRLTQVFGNLLSNAIKYTPRGGRIQVESELDGNSARIAVRDNGIGVPPEKREQIFEMFCQLDASGDPGSKGLGVGLGVVKSLVQLHGGRIEVLSGGHGAGSEFVVWLPVKDCSAQLSS